MNGVIVGRWKISRGKGERYYINCVNSGEQCEGVMHPEQLAEYNGCGVYGFKELQDLAIAIMTFEAEENEANSIVGIFKNG